MSESKSLKRTAIVVGAALAIGLSAYLLVNVPQPEAEDLVPLSQDTIQSSQDTAFIGD